MAVAGILATALTDHAARAYGLFVDGVDMIRQPITTGNGYGVPLESVELHEAGPSAVSQLQFIIEDPGAVITVSPSARVRLQDIVADAPLFDGYVQSFDKVPDPAGQGRRYRVICTGVEVLLDWAKVQSLTVVSGTPLKQAIVMCASAAVGLVEVRVFANTGIAGPSTQATPIATFGSFTLGTASLAYDVVITGQTLREALRLVTQASIRAGSDYFGAGFTTPALAQFTIDFYRGLRAMPDSAASSWTSDWNDLTVTDTVASGTVATSLSHAIDATGIVRGVHVIGANAAGTGLLMDGTGIPGQIAVITDTTVDTAAKLLDAQIGYLNSFVVGERGSFALEDWTPAAGLHPGSLLILTDAATGATGTYRIWGIEKTFTGARQTWRVDYGGLPPSMTRNDRRLTRSTLS